MAHFQPPSNHLDVSSCSDTEAVVLLLAWLASLCAGDAWHTWLPGQQLRITTSEPATGGAAGAGAHAAVVAVLQGRLAQLLQCNIEEVTSAFAATGLGALAALVSVSLEGCIEGAVLLDGSASSGVVALAAALLAARIEAAVSAGSAAAHSPAVTSAAQSAA